VSTSVKGGIIAALAALGVAGPAHAVETKAVNGCPLDRHDFHFGGRIELDGYYDDNDHTSMIGSGAGHASGDGVRFRRAWFSPCGRIRRLRLDYHIDYDFVTNSLQKAWLSYESKANHDALYVGQDKPWASLDEIASDTDTPFLERNIASSSGVNSLATYTSGLYYKWHKRRVFSRSDNLWLGASVSSLHKQHGRTSGSNQGTALNARVAYAPLAEQQRWLHFGVSFIDARSTSGSTTSGSSALLASYVYGNYFDKNEKLTLASYAASKTGAEPHSYTLGGELAGAYQRAYVQAEYDHADFGETGEAGNTVRAYSVTAAILLTSGTRTYRCADATYGAIESVPRHGAWEIALRYDRAWNDSSHGGGFTGLKLVGAIASNASLDQVSLLSVGLNYYPDDYVRFMLDYEIGKAELGEAGSDSPHTVGARFQFAF
jgi:phosphate-selective porin OprO and OprP